MSGNPLSKLGAVLLFTTLASCGGGSSNDSDNPAPPSAATPTPTISPAVSSTPVATITPTVTPNPPPIAFHTLVNDPLARGAQGFLTRATFGAREADIRALLNGRYEAWIDAQIALPQSFLLPEVDSRLADYGLDPFDKSNDQDGYPKDLARSDLWWEIAMHGEDQLRQRVAYALSQIFVISNVSDTLFHDTRGISDFHDVLATHAFGNFRDLLESVTLHPMMGEYLSMVRNEKSDPERNIRPDENYARELMQLFSIGLVELNLDGSPVLDPQGETIPTYDQDIIKAFARVFTGWMYGNAPRWYWYEWLASSEVLPMRAFESFHDSEPKVLLNGEVIPGGQSAEADLDAALDNIFAHSNIAPFISKQLIQRLVTSNPSPEYVTRVAAAFNDNGSGIKGDMTAVIKAILLDDEALSGHAQGPDHFGKLKEPMLKVAQVWRAFNVEGVHTLLDDNSLGPKVIRFYGSGRESGQRPYGSPSVFNFYRPDFSQSGEISDNNLLSPEFQILNENYITNTTNRLFIAAYATDKDNNDIDRPFPWHWDAGNVVLDFGAAKGLASEPEKMLDHLNLLLFGGHLSTELRTLILNYVNTIPGNDEGLLALRFYEALFLLVNSPEFAVQQ